jgi:LysR family glycine cleavage system transcriptional activator
MRIPSTQALRALEAFSRHGTIWQTAEELSLTRSAVSHQLRGLERELGFNLMEKNGTRVEITPRGRSYAYDVRKALNIIAESKMLNSARGLTGRLKVSCPPGFASSWLCPSLGSFIAAHPDVILDITTPRRLDDHSIPDIDVFVVFGREPNEESLLLRRVEFTPMCSPSYANMFDGFVDRRGLTQANLLHISDTHDWEEWFAEANLKEAINNRGIVFSDMNLVYMAALSSQGIMIGDEFVCYDAIARGQLVRPFDFTVQSDSAYYLTVPRRSQVNPLVDAFLRWIEDVIFTKTAQ